VDRYQITNYIQPPSGFATAEGIVVGASSFSTHVSLRKQSAKGGRCQEIRFDADLSGTTIAGTKKLPLQNEFLILNS